MKLYPLSSPKVLHLGALLLGLLSALLVITSAQHQSVTIDEPNHFYCGLEWWQNGTYTAWPENPPLSRAVVGLGPYLHGYRVDSFTPATLTTDGFFFNSYDLNYFSGGPVADQLFWIRIFVLPFFLLSVWIVWVWAQRLGGAAAGFLAVGMYATLPPIMAHSGLATTDIIFLATFVLLLWCFSRWLSLPSFLNGLWLGLSAAAALLSKFSALLFFPVAALILVILYLTMASKEIQIKVWLSQIVKSGLLAVLTTAIIVWAFFGFSFGPVGNQPIIQAGIAEGAYPASLQTVSVPAPEFFAGILLLMHHNTQGHPAFALGRMSFQGFWFFYPMSWLIKTPWPFLLFFLAGCLGAWGRWKSPYKWESMALTLIPVAITLSVLNSNINIGLRHILVVYPLGAIGASVGFIQMVDYFSTKSIRWSKYLPVGFVAWQMIIALLAFPHYLSYFNSFGGKEPGNMLVDSDLDWGQGLYDLSHFAKDQNIDTLKMAYFGVAQDCWYDLPPIKFLPVDSVVQGWVAVSEAVFQGAWHGSATPLGECQVLSLSAPGTGEYSKGLYAHKNYRWLDAYPLAGKLGGGSIRVYHIPGESVGSLTIP